MRSSVLISLLACIFFISTAKAQYPAGFSEELNIPEKGWNKTLLMSNGNTVLVHIEQGKPITVFLFDNQKKLLACTKELSAYIDINILKFAVFKGLYEINKHAVLFMQQSDAGKTILVRMSYNDSNAKMDSESIAANFHNLNSADFTVVPLRGNGRYAVIQYRKIIKPFLLDWEVKISIYDKDNNSVKEIPVTCFDQEKKDMTWLTVIGADADFENRLNICFSLNKFNNTERYVILMSIPPDSTEFVYKTLNCGSGYIPLAANFAEDTTSLKMLIVTKVKFEIEAYNPIPVNISLLAEFDKKNLRTIRIKRLDNHYVSPNETEPGSLAPLLGAPLHIVSRNGGGATLVSLGQQIVAGGTVLQNIIVRKVNETGSEDYTRPIQFGQLIENIIFVADLVHREREKLLFPSSAMFDYLVQFVSYDCRKTMNGVAIIINDEPIATSHAFFDHHKANAMYYHISDGDSSTKKLLFPNQDVAIPCSVFLESASYDMTSNTYAALASQTIGKKTKIYMSWSKLEE